MPLDRYLVRFASDDEGRDVHHEAIIPTEAVPWPPHQYAAMAVATMPDGSQQMIGIAVEPDNTATREQYLDTLALGRDNVQMTADLNFPGHASLGLVWFKRVKTSELTDEMAASEHMMRGAIYRPCTHEEIIEWLGAETAEQGVEVEVEF